MINLKTECKDCIHEKVCKNKGNPIWIKNKLAEMTLGSGPNDDYDWATMTDAYRVKIDISCSDYSRSNSSIM